MSDVAGEMKEWATGHAQEMIVILLMIVAGLIVMNQMTGGRMVRAIVCGLLFFIPFGAMANMMTQACGAINA